LTYSAAGPAKLITPIEPIYKPVHKLRVMVTNMIIARFFSPSRKYPAPGRSQLVTATSSKRFDGERV
jgi:hypothetical protein